MDCDGLIDEELDEDGDGVGSCTDCDDDQATTHPGAEELCDGVDNDCDGVVPEDELIDADGDGSPAREDCGDTDPTVLLVGGGCLGCLGDVSGGGGPMAGWLLLLLLLRRYRTGTRKGEDDDPRPWSPSSM